MLWILQNRIHERKYAELVDVLHRLNCNVQIVQPIPFTDKLIDSNIDINGLDVTDIPSIEVDGTQPIIVMGSITLEKIARQYNWSPGSFLNDNFDFNVWSEQYGHQYILNPDTVVTTVQLMGPHINSTDTVFIRPTLDNKSFAGTVMSGPQVVEWFESVSSIGPGDFIPLHNQVEVAISTPKNIISEYRLFVVAGRVVTGSMYKRGGKFHTCNIIHCDPAVIQFANRMLSIWHPADSYVLDIAETSIGFKVIEINNINSAGFYDSDLQLLVMALVDAYK